MHGIRGAEKCACWLALVVVLFVLLIGTDPALAHTSHDEPAAGATQDEPTDEAAGGTRAFAPLGTVGRIAWYAGLSLVAGSLWLGWWAAGPASGPGVRRATEALTASARRWATRGLPLAMAGAALCWAALLGARAVTREDGGSVASAMLDAYLTRSSTLWVTAAFGAFALWRHVARDPRAEPDLSLSRRRRQALVAGLVALAFMSVSAGHSDTGEAPVLGAAVGGIHLLAALAWSGPLLVVSLTAVSSGWRAVEVTERGALLRRLFTGFAPIGGWSFAVLLATGVHLGWLRLDGRSLISTYGGALLAKLAVVAYVVVPLAWNHDRLVRLWRGRAEEGKRAPGGPSFLRTVRVEALGLATVLAIAAVLVGLDPGGADQPMAAPAGEEAPAAEEARAATENDEIYFVELMEREGAEVAVARIEELSATDEQVASDCHQLTHTVGRAAATHYGSLAEALSFQASACWSGYYHGVVEETLAGYDDRDLEAAMPEVCDPAASPRYGFSHYNCIHGMGHGVMIRQQGDLFATLPFCDVLGDDWERSACAGGAFMQNVVGAQEGSEATLDEDDPSYPCGAVDEGYRADCWQMQTSWILWRNGYDYAGGFDVCNGIEADVADDCYRSMGRDISGGFTLDPDRVTETCALGSDELEVHCVVGAAANAVYDTHATARADALCAIVANDHRAACREAVVTAASTF